MKVYHASTVVVESPDTTHSRAFLDFGPGFYVTTFQDQAVKYGAHASPTVVKKHSSIPTNLQMTSANGKSLSSSVTMKHGSTS